MKHIEWQNVPVVPLSEEMIRGGELLFGVTFPADYRECVRVNHGGRPKPNHFVVPGQTVAWGSCVASLLTLDWRRSENVWASLAILAVDKQLPDGLFPFAEDGGGDFLCLDFRGGSDCPRVVYWSHDIGGDDSVVSVANSFSELLLMLE